MVDAQHSVATQLPPGSVCACHPDVGAVGVCARCGDFRCSSCVYLLLEGTSGRTIGKWITGTRVVTAKGERAGFKAIVLRTLARLVPFEAFSFLGDDRGWHDRWTDTRVVRARRPKDWDPRLALPL